MNCFHSSGKNKVHMHTLAMKYELCVFDDSAYKLNALIFFFFKWALHNIMMNSKIHANNLKLQIFLYLEWY